MTSAFHPFYDIGRRRSRRERIKPRLERHVLTKRSPNVKAELQEKLILSRRSRRVISNILWIYFYFYIIQIDSFLAIRNTRDFSRLRPNFFPYI